MEDNRQVYIVYGFLESGKTQFVNFTIRQDYFKLDEKTLVIVCEEGIDEYDKDELKDYNTYVEFIDEKEDFNFETLKKLTEKHDPARIIIEYNGMWDSKTMSLPSDWEIRQQITIADSNKFEMYFNNMKSMYADIIRNSELLIMNRCEDITKLHNYKLNIKSINNNIEVVFEDENGELDLPVMDEDLPFDLKADIVEITDQNYGVWFLDLWETTERYTGKKFHIQTIVMKQQSLPKNYFVAGRPVMTCCEDDIMFMGVICKSKEAKNLVDKDCVDMIVTVVDEYRSDYGGNGPVLYVETLQKIEPFKNPLISI